MTPVLAPRTAPQGRRTRPKTMRSFRCDDGLWRAAKARASERGESLTDVLSRALRSYVDGR
jgi:hypothetical protein